MSKDFLNLEKEAQNENTSPERLGELANMNETLAYLVAQNSSTSLETLTKLSESSNQKLIKAIVRNPNTPTDILVEIGPSFPKDLSKNPLIDLWLLEEDNPFFGNNKFKQQLLTNHDTPQKLLEILAKATENRIRIQVAKHINCPISVLKLLATDHHHEVRYQVASHPHTPLHLLEMWADQEHNGYRCGVASNPNAPIYLLEKLAQDPHEYVRWEVASNPSTPIYLLEKLAQDPHEYVRWMVGSNPNTPTKLLNFLKEDSRQGIHLCVANYAKQTRTQTQKIIKRTAMTWRILDKRWDEDGKKMYVLVGTDGTTDPYHGDTAIFTSLPILCINKKQLAKPNFISPSQTPGGAWRKTWSSGYIAITPPISGDKLTSLTVANNICSSIFGEEYRMAEFHDGDPDFWSAWDFWGELKSPCPNYNWPDRFWVHINGQPSNCWDR